MANRTSAGPRRSRAGVVGLEQRVLDRFRRLELDAPGPLVVAFSGGPDSLALAAMLTRLRPWHGRTVVAIHVDHGLRAESAAAAVRAGKLSALLGMPFQVHPVAPGALARHRGVGVEESARRERYRILAQSYRARDAVLLGVAHQLDDQAETVLLHLLRGAGLAGATGMAELTEIRVPWWDDSAEPAALVRVWRPLLEESGAELDRYLDSLGLVPIADESNADERFRRNAIRRRVLPCLEAVSPGAAEALARYARLAAADDAALEVAAGAVVDAVVPLEGTMSATAVRRQPVAIQRRMVRRWLAESSPGLELTAERIEAVRLLALAGLGGRTIELGRGVVVRCARGHLSAGSSDDSP